MTTDILSRWWAPGLQVRLFAASFTDAVHSGNGISCAPRVRGCHDLRPTGRKIRGLDLGQADPYTAFA